MFFLQLFSNMTSLTMNNAILHLYGWFKDVKLDKVYRNTFSSHALIIGSANQLVWFSS